jgi:hypothetical protein
MASTTAVTIFHPTQDTDGFEAWLAELRSSAHGAQSTSVSVRDEPGLDWALAVTFSSEDRAHECVRQRGSQIELAAGREGGVCDLFEGSIALQCNWCAISLMAERHV